VASGVLGRFRRAPSRPACLREVRQKAGRSISTSKDLKKKKTRWRRMKKRGGTNGDLAIESAGPQQRLHWIGTYTSP
jgi:hypothetical protein